MNKIEFDIDIRASAAKIWQVLWNDATYRKWTSVFCEGSYAVSDWKEGSPVQFLSPGGNGMFSVIAECKANERMAFKHLGEIKNFTAQPSDEKTKQWEGAMETYLLQQNGDSTALHVSLDALDGFADYLQKTFPAALKAVKELAENPVHITVEATVDANIEKVWLCWTSPEHIIHWNNASDDWHTPSATNDLKPGGAFSYRMEARDGSFGFDFAGVYDAVKTNEHIAYTLGDGRKVNITFTSTGNTTKVVETFEAEEVNSIDLQQGGWQAILNNFRNYTAES